jgi:hypothetical protein
MNAYLCISIDCECDKGPEWRTQKPLSFAGVSLGIAERLQPLFVRRRAKPTYLLSPEVLRDSRSVETLTTLHGDAEFGTHLHGEFAEPGAFEPDVTFAFQRDYSRDTELEKLRSLTQLFRSAFGHSPTAFRAGRFGIGRNSLELLQSLGYAVDSSVTPHVDWSRADPQGPSFRSAPTQPYWPLPSAPEIAGPKSSLLEVPVTIRPSFFSYLPIVGRWAEPRWLRPTRASVAELVRIARDEIHEARSTHPDRPVVMNAMFHNVEVVPKASPYAATKERAEAILRRVAGLLAFAEREEVEVVGLSQVPEILAEAA